MENFRMRILRNLDLAVDIILDEGQIILKKYDDLEFYLKKIANGKIYNFKARQQLKQMYKQYPEMNKGKDQDKEKNMKFLHASKHLKKTNTNGKQ